MSNNSIAIQEESTSDILTFNQLVLFEGILSAARAVISVLGIFGNTINILTFISMGIKDGFSLSMTLLAGMEIFHLIIIFLRSVAYAFFIVEYATQFVTWFPVEPFGLYFYIGHVARIFYSMAVVNTTFLSFARCMCVSRPLHFKDMFMATKSTVIVCLIITTTVGSYIPMLMTMSMTLQFDSQVNYTRFRLYLTPAREQVGAITWIVRNAVLPVSTLVAIVSCVIYMSKRLMDSALFRLKSQSFHQIIQSPNYKKEKTSSTDTLVSNLASNGTKEDQDLASKERRAIQQMVVMSIVVIVCEVPEILISLASVLVPTFAFLKPFNNIYLAVIGVNHVFQSINSSVNIIIYWKYSSRYRQNFYLAKQT
ncbi:type-1B angiotensin II receptor [Biomphalaria pfeifferi]|uniref:Type-1B angiotensin II receptor n=1 Tax=Biomphalaria pfeifferi TaxID=112525 RepID=A0AAD8BEX6_BIOPF|nr:type-1B angiotensin II receptor [Biomphalaria pfeifferi]